ncbi:unnamed protein product [Mytilus edulis]|uniref:Uncharacterized protein n=1 Tax=Mytilus edulis TaxID=6550 RepID=A0A8S3R1Z4_MYTED|nr:unnamed protein product [Mytilus edulis]
MNTNDTKNKPAGTSPGLPRSSFAARNTVAFDLCVPRNILRDTPDLTYVQPEDNYVPSESEESDVEENNGRRTQIKKGSPTELVDTSAKKEVCQSISCNSFYDYHVIFFDIAGVLKRAKRTETNDAERHWRKWTEDEENAVARHLGANLKMGKVPQKHEVMPVLQKEPILHSRSWKDITNYVYNKTKKLRKSLK